MVDLSGDFLKVHVLYDTPDQQLAERLLLFCRERFGLKVAGDFYYNKVRNLGCRKFCYRLCCRAEHLSEAVNDSMVDQVSAYARGYAERAELPASPES